MFLAIISCEYRSALFIVGNWPRKPCTEHIEPGLGEGWLERGWCGDNGGCFDCDERKTPISSGVQNGGLCSSCRKCIEPSLDWRWMPDEPDSDSFRFSRAMRLRFRQQQQQQMRRITRRVQPPTKPATAIDMAPVNFLWAYKKYS